MSHFSFDLEDGKPPVCFVLDDDDTKRFAAFMAECNGQFARIVELEATVERLLAERTAP